MSLRTGWGLERKVPKTSMLHLVFHSVNQYLAYGSHVYQYRVDPPNAPMHSRPTWLIDISPFSDKCDGYFQRCDWYFQMLLVFSDLNHGLKACL